MASQRGGDDSNGAAAPPPPPIKLSAPGGGAVDSNAQGVVTVTCSSNQEAVVSLDGSGVVKDGQKKSGEEEEKAKEGGNGGGEVAAMPLDVLNIQWTTSTSGFSEEAEGARGGGSGSVGGLDGGERVVVTHPVGPSVQPVMMEEDRDVVVPMEEVVIAEEVESSEEEGGGVSGERWRVRPRGGEDVVMTEWGRRETMGASGNGGVGGSGDDPKGKRVATEEPAREHGPVGISLGDNIVHADPEYVAALGREASGVLDAVREEVVGGREREMVVLNQAALEAEAEAEEWIRKAEEEEAELELRAWEELKVAQGPRVSVV